MPIVTYIGLPAILARGQAAMGEAVAQSGEAFVGKVQEAIGDHVVTGALKAGVHVEDESIGLMEASVRVATGGESSAYAEFVHEGTAPHLIVGNPWLFWPGASHPVHEVHHPGTAAVKYMELPLIAFRNTFLEVIAAAARGAY